MDSQVTGANPDLLKIQTDDGFYITVKGPLVKPCFSHYSNADSTLNVACASSFSIEKLGKVCLENSLGFISLDTEPLFFEQQAYELIISAPVNVDVSFWHDNVNIRNKVSKLSLDNNSNIYTGIINFRNEIGLSDLVILVDGKQFLKITIEVFPRKIDYKEDYQAIMTDVTTEVYSLVFDFMKKTYRSYELASHKSSTLVEFFSIVRKIFTDYLRAVDLILSQPHHQLVIEREVLPAHKVKRLDNTSVKWLQKHPEQIQKTTSGYNINKTMAVKKVVTYNTKENQLTKYMLTVTTERLKQFLISYKEAVSNYDSIIENSVNSMISNINRRCDNSFLNQVEAKGFSDSMSLVLSMAPGYRDLYKYYLMLQRGLSVTGELFNISHKDIAQLYEYWCFIKLCSLLKENDQLQLVSQDVIKRKSNGLTLGLLTGAASKVVFETKDHQKIILSYNEAERTTPTVPQKPDNVFTLEKKDSELHYIFDAKYKIGIPGEDNYYYSGPGPKEQDINTMHRYRDAIVYENSKSKGVYENAMVGAYVLFPYNNEEEYEEHKFYKSIAKVNIGGLPFLPGSTDLVSDFLKELIEK